MAKLTLALALNILISGFAAGAAAAAPLPREEVPAPLQSWISWALRGREHQLCAPMTGSDRRVCAWPGALKLSVDERTGSFEQSWTLQAPGFAMLPGGPDRWPVGVKVDGVPAAVVKRGEMPAVFLKAGTRSVSGSFTWARLPEQIEVPNETGLLALTLKGAAVPFPVRDDGGRLWLGARVAQAQAPKEEARLDVTVHRRLMDETPLLLLTRLQLKISGAARELTLGPVLPDGFEPMSLTGSLPARLDGDGKLRVQARAGTWDIMIQARSLARSDELKTVEAKAPWPTGEAWVFDARPQLRLADLTGAPSLDPQQTELPYDWRSLPAFLVRPGQALKLVQRQRGEDPPPPDRLSIQRQLWLDFDGGGLSSRDVISGTLARSWRLEASEETALGRVAMHGQDQFLSMLSCGAPAGLEVRDRQLHAQADSRVDRAGLTATGWKHDFESASASLALPPGWRLLHASGVDRASPTWISRWSLLDFFLVLVAAAAFSRLFGLKWGALALAGLALSWHEPDAPRWLWLASLFCAALWSVLEFHPSAGRWVTLMRRGVWGLLVLSLIPFLIKQARYAMYPELERPGHAVQFNAQPGLLSAGAGGSEMPEEADASMAADEEHEGGRREKARRDVSSMRGYASKLAKPYAPSAAAQSMNQRQNLIQLDPNAKVATGPGLPNWEWTRVQLAWRGPVPQGSRVRLWLLPPWANFILGFARIALAVLLALAVAGFPVDDWISRRRELARRALPLLLLGLLSGRAGAAEFPPRDMLDELANRMTAPHECQPFCADASRLRLKATDGFLSMSLDVDAAAATAVPIPSGGREWTPARVLVGGKPAGARREDGQLWVALPAGAHTLTLEGPLPARDSVSVSLPLRPKRASAEVSGWSLHGLREDGRPDDTLQLSRTRAAQAAQAEERMQGLFSPFLHVQRNVHLGLSWHVETIVTRLTPPGQPVTAQIPLLPGEAPTTEIRTLGGKALVNLPPQVSQVSWTSALRKDPALEFAAQDTALWREEWNLNVSALWNAAPKGLPPVAQGSNPGPQYSFRPWPGEKLSVGITRPMAVDGQTLTIDESELRLSPGLRATEAALKVSVRTSRGAQHALTLPEGAELLSAAVDGVRQPLRLEGRRLVVPLTPGKHTIDASWREPGGQRPFYRASRVDLGAPAVNSHVAITMPEARWSLLLWGPGMGPAVLFWSVLFVFLIASVGLAKTGLAPLGVKEWFLLSLGMTQVGAVPGAIVAGWFLAVGLRGRRPPPADREFKVVQVLLLWLTLFAVISLFGAIKSGLLGMPEMQIRGNGSTSQHLRWYVDRVGPLTPEPWVLSVPLGVYRAAMLLWALWLAESVLRWARWAWAQYTTGGLWSKTTL